MPLSWACFLLAFCLLAVAVVSLKAEQLFSGTTNQGIKQHKVKENKGVPMGFMTRQGNKHSQVNFDLYADPIAIANERCVGDRDEE